MASLLLSIAACGSAAGPTAPPWRAGHPDQPAIAFLSNDDLVQQSLGVCSIAVPDPEAVPSAMRVPQGIYIQRERTTMPPPSSHPAATSGDWTMYALDAARLLLVTPRGEYLYRSASTC